MAQLDWIDGIQAGGKMALLYWGAPWCPPCNRVKSEIFSHPDFAALAPRLALLRLEGDAPAAQRLAAQLKLRSYPTLVLYGADGLEITRLPCELDGAEFTRLLALAMLSPARVDQLLASALSGEPLSDEGWHLLAGYSWDTDEQQLLGGGTSQANGQQAGAARDLATTLATLAAVCPLAQPKARLSWLAVQAALARGLTPPAVDLLQVLNQPQAVRAQWDLVVNFASDLVRGLTPNGSSARAALAASFSGALLVLEQEPCLSPADRLAALRARVRMARLGGPDTGLEQLAARVEATLELASDGAQRHYVLNTGAGLLLEHGQLEAADALLRANLAQSHAPYYFMHTLAAIAKRRGDADGVLEWYRQAWEQAQGDATRLQWGVTYLLALLDASCPDQGLVAAAARDLQLKLVIMHDDLFQRNAAQVARLAKRLRALESTSDVLQSLLAALS